MSHWLSINAWNWKLSDLRALLLGASKMDSFSSRLQKVDARVLKWERGMKGLDRVAIGHLKAMSREFKDPDAAELFALFLVRLTTLIMPDHRLALESLQKMQAPAFLRWGLENWMLSEEYSDLRKQQRSNHRVPVPKGLMIGDLSTWSEV